MSESTALSRKTPRALLRLIENAIQANHDEFEVAFEGGSTGVRSEYRTPAFGFVRQLRERDEFLELASSQAASVILPAMLELRDAAKLPYTAECRERGLTCPHHKEREWGTCRCPDMLWWDALPAWDSYGKDADPRENFSTLWDSWEVTPFRRALHALDHHPLWRNARVFGRKWSARNRGNSRRFLALCYELANQRTDGVFFLPVRTFAEALGVDQPSVSGWRRMAMRDGFVEQVAEETPHGGPAAKAAEFRWVAPFHQTQKPAGRFVPRHAQPSVAEQLRCSAAERAVSMGVSMAVEGSSAKPESQTPRRKRRTDSAVTEPDGPEQRPSIPPRSEERPYD